MFNFIVYLHRILVTFRSISKAKGYYFITNEMARGFFNWGGGWGLLHNLKPSILINNVLFISATLIDAYVNIRPKSPKSYHKQKVRNNLKERRSGDVTNIILPGLGCV